MGFCPGELCRAQRAGRIAAFQNGCGGLPAELRRLARDQQSIVAQALHQGTDNLESGLREFRKRDNGLLVFLLSGESAQGGLVDVIGGRAADEDIVAAVAYQAVGAAAADHQVAAIAALAVRSIENAVLRLP